MIGADWGQLVAQGRAKALGVAWSEEELNALHVLKIPLEHVRGGCLTLEQYEKATKGEPESKYMKKDDLLLKAKELGIEISEGATPSRADLMLMIEEKSKKSEEISDAA
jgi:hypothetical protein